MSFLVMLPIIIPFLIGVSAFFRTRLRRRIVAGLGGLANVIACGFILYYIATTDTMIVSQMGGHPAPFGITFVIEMLSALMLLVTAIVAFAVILYSYATIDINRERFIYFPLIGFLLMGINLAFITGDLFTLYVAFELMLLSSFVLMTLGGERGQIEGGIKYVAINLISSTIFLIATGLTYAVAGTLNIADLSVKLADIPAPGITTLLTMLFLLAFGIKAAIFPLFYWLPASYHTPPIAVTALFGGLLTKIGIYSMWQVLVVVFPNEVRFLQPLILTLAAFTMIAGVLGAIAQGEWRRLLSFHVISQIGYLLMGLGLSTEMGMAGSIVFVLHVILSKTALFFIAGIAYEIRDTYKLKYLGGFRKNHRWLSVLFLIAALSLAGIPPLSGFWGKMILIRAGLEAGQYVIVAVALVVSLLTFYSMLKIWNEVFWKDMPANVRMLDDDEIPYKRQVFLYIPTVLLAVLIIAMGILAEPISNLASHAAQDVYDPSQYRSSILLLEEER